MFTSILRYGIFSQFSSLWNGLMAYYKFDETSGTIAYDSYGGNNGTYVGDTTLVAGKSGNAVDINSTSEYVSLPLGVFNELEYNQPFSWSMWIKRNAISFNYGYFYVHSKQTSPYTGWRWFIDNTNDTKLEFRGTSTSVGIFVSFDTSSVFNDTTNWHHVVATYDGSGTANANTLIFYVDGVVMTAIYGSATINTSIKTTALATIGKVDLYSNNPNTKYDEFGAWNRFLSASDVAQLYNNGVGRFL